MNKQHLNFVDDNDFLGRMYLLTGNNMYHDLRNASDNMNADLTDALSWGQLKSKRWLVDELAKCNAELRTVFIMGGWYGTLASMLFNSDMIIHYIRSFDIDDSCQAIADKVNNREVQNNWRFKAVTDDMHSVNLDAHTWSCWSAKNNRNSFPITDRPDTIINTSCEHIDNFANWYNTIPKGKLVVLQTNDYDSLPEHINCVKDTKDFAEQTPLSKVLYEGRMPLNKYTRYMRIGYR
jgi:hypothetical protein